MDGRCSKEPSRSLVTVICSLAGLVVGFGLIVVLPKALWVPLAPVYGPILGTGIGRMLEQRGVGPRVSAQTAVRVLAGLTILGAATLVVGAIVWVQL